MIEMQLLLRNTIICAFAAKEQWPNRGSAASWGQKGNPLARTPQGLGKRPTEEVAGRSKTRCGADSQRPHWALSPEETHCEPGLIQKHYSRQSARESVGKCWRIVGFIWSMKKLISCGRLWLTHQNASTESFWTSDLCSTWQSQNNQMIYKNIQNVSTCCCVVSIKKCLQLSAKSISGHFLSHQKSTGWPWRPWTSARSEQLELRSGPPQWCPDKQRSGGWARLPVETRKLTKGEA